MKAKACGILMVAFSPIMYILAILLPKKKNRYCFGAWFGGLYSDNSRYLFEAASASADLDAIWITKSAGVIRLVASHGYKVFHAYSIKGIYYQLTAEVMFCSVNSRDLNPACIGPKTKFIQLWHGLPLKKIGFDVNAGPFNRFKQMVRKKTIDRYSAVISPSPVFDRLFCSAFRIPSNQIISAPYPRWMGMLASADMINSIKTANGIATNRVIVAYLPTHRDEGKSIDVISSAIAALIEHEEVIADCGIQVVVKLHSYDFRHRSSLASSETIHIIENDTDVYPILAVADGLITDYSSVMFDYACLNRPIAFYLPDLQSYRLKNRDLYFETDTFIRRYASSAPELLDSITDIVDRRDYSLENFRRESLALRTGNSTDYAGECLSSVRKYLDQC